MLLGNRVALAPTKRASLKAAESSDQPRRGPGPRARVTQPSKLGDLRKDQYQAGSWHARMLRQRMVEACAAIKTPEAALQERGIIAGPSVRQIGLRGFTRLTRSAIKSPPVRARPTSVFVHLIRHRRHERRAVRPRSHASSVRATTVLSRFGRPTWPAESAGRQTLEGCPT